MINYWSSQDAIKIIIIPNAIATINYALSAFVKYKYINMPNIIPLMLICQVL